MRKKAYVYTRVSTLMQVDGNSLEGQLKEIEKYCGLTDTDIVAVYSDEGKSGKSISGRPEFQKMMKDIEEKKEVDYVIVWKLSRFGRNAKDTLNSLGILQKHGVELCTAVERINSGDKMGMFMLTMLSALAEMERENIIEQTNNGKKYNALDGKWNGGAAPYGYKLVDKQLVVVQEEAEVVKRIFNEFVYTDLGYNGVTALLNKEKIKPRQTKRLDRKAMAENDTDKEIYLPIMEDWYSTIVKKILDCPVYCGKIRWGHENVVREDGKEKRKKGENVILVDGIHKAIISEELWKQAQEKRKKTGVAFGRPDSNRENVRNMFNRIAKCPNCGHGMVSYKEPYINKDKKTVYYYKYMCGYYNNHRNGKCQKNAIKADYLEGAVIDEILKYIRRPNLLEDITKHLSNKLDTSNIEREIEEAENKLIELDKKEEVQYNILSKIGSGQFRNMKPEKIEKTLEEINQQREETENYIDRKHQEIRAIEQDKLNCETIKFLIENFEAAYHHASKEQQKRLIQSMVKEVRLGYLGDTKKVIPVSMTLKITGEQIELYHENKVICGEENSELSESNVETVVLLSKLKSAKSIEVKIELDEMDLTTAESKATYDEIKQYVLDNTGLKVSQLYVAQVKRKHGLIERINYNVGDGKSKVPHVPLEKEKAIEDALRHFKMI